MTIGWKTNRITVEAWKKVKKAIAGEDVDLDDFVSYIIEMCDVEDLLSNYLSLLAEEEEEEGEEDKEGE